MGYYKNEKKEQATKEKNWSTVSGTMYVFRNEYKGRTFFSTSVSRDVDGKTYREFLKVCFSKKCKEPEEKVNKITLTDAFITLDIYEDQNGLVQRPMIMIMGYDD